MISTLRLDTLSGADPPRLVEKVKTLSSKSMDVTWSLSVDVAYGGGLW